MRRAVLCLACVFHSAYIRRGSAFLTASTQCGRSALERRRPNLWRLHETGTGWTDVYSWVEKDDDLEVRINLGQGVTARDLEVDIRRSSVKVSVLEAPLLQGEWQGKVSASSSFWTTEEMAGGDRQLYLHLEKADDDDHGGLWMGVLRNEDPLTTQLLYGEYKESDEDFDVDEYVQSLGGVNPDAVDETMFAGLADTLKEGMMGQVQARGGSADAGSRPPEDVVVDVGDSDSDSTGFDSPEERLDRMFDEAVEAGLMVKEGQGEEGLDSEDFEGVAFTDSDEFKAADDSEVGACADAQ
ncbi:hypothetical protein JKP88DRAFT_228932 [Tribonema minus]|uniref:CS domain-containing protein n=1 Tax=Tribonema minus TaxID=303371 RepID=A0A835YH47_9STRA|nr:hypothetical protein JKP88DRAFT_228932 [Tribonema minus]